MKLPTIPYVTAFKSVHVFGVRIFGMKLINFFHHDFVDHVNFGFGILQINNRHLFFYGNDGFRYAFLPPAKEKLHEQDHAQRALKQIPEKESCSKAICKNGGQGPHC